ncbi:nuclear factor 7, ovary-like isoform X2 [Narcine bancroftii]|uniref:nuclear factor 7, ovary-like isoform X2 n=1 Tax=Narcine bancroftii TaxID=1343680 RepID=UPI003831F05C
MRSALLSPAEGGPAVARALRRELTCSVCLELFREPVVLGCGHNFCRSCIVRVWESRERQRRRAAGRREHEARHEAQEPGSAYPCPQCRQIFPVKSFTKNFLAANLVERLLDSKSVTRTPGDSHPKQCKRHRKPVTLHCATDKKILCDVCRLSKAHRTCDVLLVHELTEEFLRRKELKARIVGEFAKLIEFLIEEREGLLAELEEEESVALEEVAAGQVDLATTVLELERSISHLQNKLSHPVSLKEMLDTISQPIPQLEKSPVSQLNPRWEHFTGPLQFITWRRMQDIINPGPENLYFNPLSAHPNLRFNSDLTTVESSGTRGPPPADSTERFTSFHAVLANACYGSGRRYWEVEVGSSLAWYLGVTCVHSSRKGYIRLAPSNGYWSICRLLEYWINGERRCKLHVTSELSRVGVYLDVEGGRLSFYDTCSMDLLCTFHTTFQSPVCPFFSPSRDTDSVLKLCHF